MVKCIAIKISLVQSFSEIVYCCIAHLRQLPEMDPFGQIYNSKSLNILYSI